MEFCKENLDFQKSPYTGLTRESWKEAGRYILTGLFKNVSAINDPLVLIRQERQITYPHDEDNLLEKMAERFEGLARSFFIAAPLIHDDPSLVIRKISLTQYYKDQILKSCDPNSPLCVGRYQDLSHDATGKKLEKTFQQTVESAGLVIGLWLSKEEIWEHYSLEEKKMIADFIAGYGYGKTIHNNWQLFNMLDLAFLHVMGFTIDKKLMHHYAEEILAFYAGDGWYRDGHTFDYYTCWAFQLYAPIWNLWYGEENEPEIAEKFSEYAKTFMETFPNLFDEKGYVNLWGRSMIYRNAPTAAFFGQQLLKSPTGDPGLARRICSGALLQFFKRKDVFYDGVPSLGFYRQFPPMLQGYSCAASPLWLGKAFLILYLPEEHLFWQAKENNGIWQDKTADAPVHLTTLNGPALSFSNHFANGQTILRSGKVLRNAEVYADMWGYGKLCFNTQYPWEATPADFLEAQQYVLLNNQTQSFERGNLIAWQGDKQGVLYRRLFFNYTTPKEFTWLNTLDLVDFPVANGLIRVDWPHFIQKNYQLTLGSFGFPDNLTTVKFLKEEPAQALVLKGYDQLGQEKQLVFTCYSPFKTLDIFNSQKTNPESLKSIIAYAKTDDTLEKQNLPVLISQTLTKESHEDFLFDEIFPIEKIEKGGHGRNPLQVDLLLKNGQKKIIDYTQLTGNLSI